MQEKLLILILSSGLRLLTSGFRNSFLVFILGWTIGGNGFNAKTPRCKAAKRHRKLAGDNVPGERVKWIASRSDDGKRGESTVPSGRISFWALNPGTMCRANLRLSLPGRAKAEVRRIPQGQQGAGRGARCWAMTEI
jgi:hypothetical protein